MDKGAEGRNRPFYELPTHIKPCSQIIQETRLQLQYSRKVPAVREVDVKEIPPLLSTINGESALKMRSVAGYSVGAGTMRPVNTQRPFTPRDSASLWGVSARKRPPSAITLSRLSMPIEDGEESGLPTTTASTTFGNISPVGSTFFGGGRIWGLEPKNSLGSLSSNSGSLAGIAESDYDEACLQRSSNGILSAEPGIEVNLEKARLEIKQLSLQNVTSPFPEGTLGMIGAKDTGHCVEESMTKKARHSDVDVGDNRGCAKKEDRCLSNLELGHGDSDRSSEKTEEDPYRHINNLEVAIEYLSSFVKEYETLVKPPKADIICILKKIREALSHGIGLEDYLTSKLRRKLLELIFKLVEKNQNDDNILFWSSFVLLHCNIIGHNLTTVFKMVFKSSKSKENTDTILGTEYLEVLMRSLSQICPKTQTESMIYGYGTLKFLCGDNSVLKRVIDLNLIPIIALHLKILNCEIACHDTGRVSEGIFNGTFQLTSILRSVVGENRALILVVQSGLMEQLCETMRWGLVDIDVLKNIMRILSVVSMDGLCCQVMYNNETFCLTVVRVLAQWYDKNDIMVRIAYCIGNLLANSDDMRIKLFEEPDAFQYILKLMCHYLDKPASPSSIDILIKTTRVIANWILNPFVGSIICDDTSLSDVLYTTLQTVTTSQELILCVMCTLNNTSFYINCNELDDGTMKTAEYLFQNLNSQELEVRTEIVKVLGNLTRNEDVRLMSAKYMEHILMSFDETQSSPEFLCAVCGVLINVVVEELVKVQFLHHRGVERVIGVLERIDNVMVSLITCQVIWNLLISHENQGFDLHQCISSDQRMQLKKLLNEKLGKVQQNCKETDTTIRECDNDHGDDGSCNCFSTFQLIAEDFLLVAKDLLLKL